MTDAVTINVAQDFSSTPGGRYMKHGPASGEEFRERFLLPEIRRGNSIVVVLDGAWGYPASFLEEAFGGIVRELNWTVSDFDKHVKVVGSEAFSMYVDDVRDYVAEAAKKR